MLAEEIIADGLMSVAEAMNFLSISRSHLYELMERGEIAYAKIGRSRRIPKKLLVNFVVTNLKCLDRYATLGSV